MNIRSWIYKNCTYLAPAWGLVIFILCATPGQYIPSANWLELLSFDKFVHASMFFVLTSLCFLVVIRKEQPPVMRLLCFLLCVTYGALLELMQATCFSNRSADWKDIIANTFGCAMAYVFLKQLRKISDQTRS